MERKKIALATLAALAGNSIFGFSFMFSRIALRAAEPFVMLMYRFLLAFAAVQLIALYARRKNLGGWLRFAPDPKARGGLIALGLVQPVIYYLTMVSSVAGDEDVAEVEELIAAMRQRLRG